MGREYVRVTGRHKSDVRVVERFLGSGKIMIRLQSLPGRRHQVACVDTGVSKPIFRSDDPFIRVGIQPGSPPGKGTIGDQKMPAVRHQLQVVTEFKSFVLMAHEFRWEIQRNICPAPIHIIGKDEELRFAYLSSQVIGTTQEIFPVGSIQGIDLEKIRAPHIEADCITRLNSLQQFLTFWNNWPAKVKIPAYLLFYPLKIFRALPPAIVDHIGPCIFQDTFRDSENVVPGLPPAGF